MNKVTVTGLSGMTAFFLLLPGAVLADEAVASGANTAWILTSTALVLFMTLPGLALFYGGLVRSKNVLSVLLQCFAIAGLVSILWLIAGYSLAFGEGNAAARFVEVLADSGFWSRSLQKEFHDHG